jgi:hypothetical protein
VALWQSIGGKAMRRLRVLYLPLASVDPVWQEEVVKAVAPRHDLAIHDAGKDLAAQFAGIEAVLDTGGSVGTREMNPA